MAHVRMSQTIVVATAAVAVAGLLSASRSFAAMGSSANHPAMNGSQFYWNDCMTYLDDPAAGMTAQHVPPGGVLTLQVDEIDDFASRCPEQYEALVECCAFVNWRRIERGAPPVLALSFYKTPSVAG